jgi:putative endonuclease
MCPCVDRRLVGARAEAAAARALAARGYRIVARNVRLRGGELDLVCRDGDAFVFCEVKARAPSGFGVAEEALTAAKRARLARLAQAYLARSGGSAAPFRIELVAVRLDDERRVAEIDVVPLA